MKKISFLLFACCVVFTSCEDALVKTLELDDFDYEKQLAISGSLISTEDEFRLLISENQAITDPFDEWKPAKEATATLFQGETAIGDLDFQEADPNGGLGNLFTLSLANVELDPGNYRLEVEHPTLGNAIAQTEIPVDIKVDEIEFVEDYGIAPSELTRSDAVLITFSDPPENNYYSLKFELETILFDTFINGLDTFIYENYPYLGVDSGEQGAQFIRDGILFSDSFFNGQEHTVVMYLTGLDYVDDKEELLDGIKITWDVMSRDKYEFDRSLQLYYDSQNFGPFSEAVTIFNNFEGGVGIFSGLNRSFYPIP